MSDGFSALAASQHARMALHRPWEFNIPAEEVLVCLPTKEALRLAVTCTLMSESCSARSGVSLRRIVPNITVCSELCRLEDVTTHIRKLALGCVRSIALTGFGNARIGGEDMWHRDPICLEGFRKLSHLEVTLPDGAFLPLDLLSKGFTAHLRTLSICVGFKHADVERFTRNVPGMPGLETLRIVPHRGQRELATHMTSALIWCCPRLRVLTGALVPPLRQVAMPPRLEILNLQLPEPSWFEGIADLLCQCGSLSLLSVQVSFHVLPTPVAGLRLPSHSALSSLSLECTLCSYRLELLKELLRVCSRLRSLALMLRFTAAGSASFAGDLPPMCYLEELDVEFAGTVWGLGADLPGSRACKALALALIRTSKVLRRGCVVCREMGPAFVLQVVQQSPHVVSVEEMVFCNGLRLGCRAPNLTLPYGSSSLGTLLLRSPLEDRDGWEALVEVVKISPMLEKVQVQSEGVVVTVPRGAIESGHFWSCSQLNVTSGPTAEECLICA